MTIHEECICGAVFDGRSLLAGTLARSVAQWRIMHPCTKRDALWTISEIEPAGHPQ